MRRVDLAPAVGDADHPERRTADPDALVRWASGEPWLQRRPWLRVLSWIGPLALIALALLWALDVVPAIWMVAPVVVNTIVFTLFASPAATRVQVIVPLRDAIAGYRDIFGTIASSRPSAFLLPLKPSPTSNTVTTPSNPPTANLRPSPCSHAHLFRLCPRNP